MPRGPSAQKCVQLYNSFKKYLICKASWRDDQCRKYESKDEHKRGFFQVYNKVYKTEVIGN